MRALLSTEPLKDSSGALIFKYWKGIYYGMLMLTVMLVIGVICDPPGVLGDILIAAFLTGATLFMSIQASKFHLSLKNNVITRCSPWPWHKYNNFELSRVSSIHVGGYPMRLRINMNHGTQLEVPILLLGAFRLLLIVANNSNATITNEAKEIIDYYAQ